MLFNSLDFAMFLPIVFVLYWFVFSENLKYQNLLLVIASYIFYGWWDWRFLSLILCSSGVDYVVGLQMHKTIKLSKRKQLLWISLVVNLGFLGVCKYYNFFLDNFIQAFTLFGLEIQGNALQIILPVGISFYTFQTLSYTIDVYRNKLEPTKDWIAFSAFVTFFPQLVAGPIERATNLLPQFYKKRIFDYEKATDGLRQILWGLFKKVVIADTCAGYANTIFQDAAMFDGSTLAIGVLFFTFQIYGDFSGYSDIAIGTSRLFGFSLSQNFAFPYFSRDIAEFWRRWHISLSTWFRDYVYIPLGGSRGGIAKKIRNTFIIFGLSGFWHGAKWTFVIWGFLNALYFLPLLLLKRNRSHLEVVAQHAIFPSIKEALQMGTTFMLTGIAWIFFRAENVSQAFVILNTIFSKTLLVYPEIFPKKIFLLVFLFFVIEWFGRKNSYAIARIKYRMPVVLRWSTYLLLIGLVLYNSGQSHEFIYFQF